MDVVFNRVGKRFGQRDALADLSFELQSGEMAFLTGRSGAGKSTLLRLLLLLERASSGDIAVGGTPLSKIKPSGIAKYRRDFGVVFQDHQLLSDRSVYHNVALPLEIAGFTQRDIDRRVRAALDKVGLLDRERANPDTLSGGEQQRVGIARAVVARPKILIADEPTGNLDTATSMEIMNLFGEIQAAGNTVILVTHEEDIAECAQRIVRLRDGKVESGNG